MRARTAGLIGSESRRITVYVRARPPLQETSRPNNDLSPGTFWKRHRRPVVIENAIALICACTRAREHLNFIPRHGLSRHSAIEPRAHILRAESFARRARATIVRVRYTRERVHPSTEWIQYIFIGLFRNPVHGSTYCTHRTSIKVL
jgi:hypothetical protein